MVDTIELVVGGKRYAGWKSIRVMRSIESISGSFDLDVTDRWGADPAWPIMEEDPCRVEINSVPVIDGYVDKRRRSATKEVRSLSYSGRDRAAALVDNSAIVDAGSVSKGKWTFYNVDLPAVAAAIAEPFGVPVSVQSGLGLAELTKQTKVVVHPGDTCFEVIARLAAAAGVLVVSDAAGGIILTRAGSHRATPLVEAQNIRDASVEHDSTERFYRYLLSSQIPGTDEASGEATRIQAEAIDEGVRRKDRVLLVRPEKGYSLADSRKRAEWEARSRAARSEKVSITVVGWTQPNGKLWPINAITRVVAPTLIGVNGDMLISSVEHSISESGQVTQLGLVRPDAFDPEPSAKVKPASGLWTELAKGAL